VPAGLAIELPLVRDSHGFAGIPFFVHSDKHRKILVCIASDKMIHIAATSFLWVCLQFTQNPGRALS